MRTYIPIVSCYCSAVVAESFRLPLTASIQKVSSPPKIFRRSQHVLSSHEVQSDMPIYNTFYSWFQLVDISIGTPPQPFRALLDIGWQDLMVPSIECEKSPTWFCEIASNFYNASESSTSHALRSPIQEYFRDLSFTGERMRDTVTIAGIDVEKQVFNSASSVDGWAYFSDYDGTLGLDRHRYSSTQNQLNAPSPWQNIMDRGVLDKNMFSVTVPQPEDDQGELILGGIDEAYADELVTIPLENLDRRIESTAPSAWIIQANSVSLGDRHEEFPTKYHAVFVTADAFIGLPEEFADHLMDTIGAEKGGFQRVPCDNRNSMPNLKFNLGPQHMEVVVTPWQYIMEVKQDGRTGCWAPFYGISYDNAPDLDGNKFVVLGAAFLRSVHSVFDVDKQSVSLAPIRT